MEVLFWMSLGFIVYVYAGYPVLLDVWARLVGRRRHRTPDGRTTPSAGPAEPRDLPYVSVVIAARNEAPRLPGRIENVLQSAYPRDRLQIIVASDGSTDETGHALASCSGSVELLHLPPQGKAGALNAAVARARHPILVFADARQRFAPDAIRHLVSHFDDPSIGAVSGELLLDCETPQAPPDGAAGAPSTIGDGIGAYWRYEKWLRRREAIVGSTLGVTGAIYAMRRQLWEPLPADTILDDVHAPMRAVLRGYRVTFDDRAQAYDRAAGDAAAELRRKVRTLAGNYQLLAREPRLLLPGVNPVWVQFVSHKICRLLVPYALMGLLIASAALAGTSLFYGAALAAQAAFYGLAAYGAVLDRRDRSAPPAMRETCRDAA